MRGEALGQSSVDRNEDIDNKDKKKKRRSRRSKQSSTSLSVSSSINEQVEVPEVVERGSSSILSVSNGHRASAVAFHSLPIINTNETCEAIEEGDMPNRQLFSSDSDGRMLTSSCPEPTVGTESSHPYTEGCIPQYNEYDGYGPRKIFSPYWSMETVNLALEKGDAFKALFRVNAYNRLEAYCTIDGLQTDVLIGGVFAQNRAVEGDIVVIKIDPPSLWTRMKGSTGGANTAASADESNLFRENTQFARDSLKGKNKVDGERDCTSHGIHLYSSEHCESATSLRKNGSQESVNAADHCYADGNCSPMLGALLAGCAGGLSERFNTVENLSSILSSYPSKRPTGKVMAILEMSPRRHTIVGFLNVKQWISCREASRKDYKKNKNSLFVSSQEYILLSPTDPKFPRMVVPVASLPGSIRRRLMYGDTKIDTDLVAAQIVSWGEGSSFPEAHVTHNFGRGSELQPRIDAILFENSIHSSGFPPEILSYLSCVHREVPREELLSRRDFRNLCTFTIDPATATDLDDALSVERLSNGISRVGVHIADVSYFVQPGTLLDMEAQKRSTTVYLLQSRLPLLPPLLSENMSSLNPGVDRLAFSIFWDINPDGEVLDRWIGRTIRRSCCKLSYEHAEKMIDGIVGAGTQNTTESGLPDLLGHFEWSDVIGSVKNLHEIAKTLKRKRFSNGALNLECRKVAFLFDEDGIPLDIGFSVQKEPCSLVEEFMLLANTTAAEIIYRAYPSCALLRRHPEPNPGS